MNQLAENTILSEEERVDMALRALYEKHGYSRFKMSKFEEYDLYARNKDFLVSDNIITFTEANGKLMALKPDVTLSIVRGSRDMPGSIRKLYYNENVYRVSGNTHAFREIMQAGLECIGEIDDYCLAEVLILAAKSLGTVSPDSRLVVSHLGVVSGLLDRTELTSEQRKRALRMIAEKNAHELDLLLCEAGTDETVRDRLCRLIRLHGSAKEVFPQLRETGVDSEAVRQMDTLSAALDKAGFGGMISFDFSVVNNMRYYNGIVFKGYVSGIPVSVLSGGQYDRLLKKMGRESGAVGFAVYLDTIERLNARAEEYDVDTVLLFSEGQDIADVYEIAEQLRQAGSVLTVQKLPEKLRCRRVLRAVSTETGVTVAYA